MEARRKTNEEKSPIQHFNIILLGKKGAGKSVTGNTIIGREVFSSMNKQNESYAIFKESVTIDGARFDVYDTPGHHAPETNKEDIMNNLQVFHELDESLPTVILLVIKTKIITNEKKNHFDNLVRQLDWSKPKYKKTIELMENLPSWLRQNTWFLFTRGDELERGNLTIKAIIDQTDGLKTAVHKLRNRYHVFNNMSRNPRQVKQLIKKIKDAPLKMSPKIHTFHRTVQSASKRNPLERRIVLLGKTGAGKSATANTILGEKRFRSEFCPSSVTTWSEMQQAVVSGKTVHVIDTPGLFDTNLSPEEMAKEIGRSIYLSSPGPHAFLYVLQLNIRFTEQEQDVVQKFEMMFGQDMRKYTIILFTHGDQSEGKSADTLIKMNSALNNLVQQCGGFHVFNNKDKENREQVSELMEKIDRLVEKNGGSCYSNEMFEDAARFRQEEQEKRKMMEGERKKKKELQSPNVKEAGRSKADVKIGLRFEEAARLEQKEKIRLKNHDRNQKEQVKGETDLIKKAEGVKVKTQIFNQFRQGEEWSQKEKLRRQREEEKQKGVKGEQGVKMKMQMFEKTMRCTHQTYKKQWNEEKERKQQKQEMESIIKETVVKVRMQKFEKTRCSHEEEDKNRKKKEEKEMEEEEEEEEEEEKEEEKEGEEDVEEEEVEENDDNEDYDDEDEIDEEKEEEKENFKKEVTVKLKMQVFETQQTFSQNMTANKTNWEEKRKHKEKEENIENVMREKDMKVKLQMFEKANFANGEKDQKGENKKKEKNEERQRNLKNETDMNVKTPTFEKSCCRQEEKEGRYNEVEEKKGKKENKEKPEKKGDLKLMMKMFEKAGCGHEKKEGGDKEEKEKTHRDEKEEEEKQINVKGMMKMFEKASNVQVDEEKRQLREDGQEKVNNRNNKLTAGLSSGKIETEKKDCIKKQEVVKTHSDQKERQDDRNKEEVRQEREVMSDEQKQGTKCKTDDMHADNPGKESAQNTPGPAPELDSGLERFLEKHDNHLSAAGHVGSTFRQIVVEGASAGAAAGATFGAAAGIVLGPVGAAVGAVLGGFIGGVGGAVGSAFRAILTKRK